MQNIKISLVDSDFVVHANAEVAKPENKKGILNLFQRLDEDFIQGEGAYLEIDGLGDGDSRSKFIISRVEA